MPIITPSYPAMCTTHNVNHSTKAVIQMELHRAAEIVEKIVLGEKSTDDDGQIKFGKKSEWKELFVKHSFFTAGYKYYLYVQSASTTKEAQQLWSGFVESKVRILVGKLTDGQSSIAIAHPFNKGFNRAHRCRNEKEIEAVKSGSMAHYAKDLGTETTGHGLALGASKDGGADGETNSKDEEDVTMVYTTTNYIGLELYEGKFSIP